MGTDILVNGIAVHKDVCPLKREKPIYETGFKI